MLWHVLVPPAIVSQSTPAEEDRRQLMQKREGPHVQSGVREGGGKMSMLGPAPEVKLSQADLLPPVPYVRLVLSVLLF